MEIKKVLSNREIDWVLGQLVSAGLSPHEATQKLVEAINSIKDKDVIIEDMLVGVRFSDNEVTVAINID